MELTREQIAVIEAPIDAKILLFGPAGSGKTTTGVERMRALLNAGVPGESILMLTPQRTLQEPYLELLHSPGRGVGGEVTPATMGGLARRMCELFWPLAAEAAGFARPDQPPIFLTLETAQYYMAYIVRPLLEQGYFESVTIDRNRLYSQIIDNLNKAALVGFAHTDIGVLLDSTTQGDASQRRIYANAQDCANRFRAFCLQYNLLDFSLQMEVFANVLWPQPVVRNFLTRSYRHLIYDNVEEDSPRAHDLLREWLPDFESALLVFDEGGGYRKFLGADTGSGWALGQLCGEQVEFRGSFVSSPAIVALEDALVEAIRPSEFPLPPAEERREAFSILRRVGSESELPRFYPELLDAVADETARLLEAGLPASEVVILAPYLSDALRFALTHRLEARGIPWRSHRPSRALRDEPASHALLTLAALAHPAWNIHPPRADVANALMQAIEDLDLVRAHLLTEIVYRARDVSLTGFENIQAEMQARITYVLGERFSTLREWLMAYREGEKLPLDHFLRKIFGEVLSQPGFGFHSSLDAVRVAASLVESVQKFRRGTEMVFSFEEIDPGLEYLAMLQDGVIAAQYLESWQPPNLEAVLVAPAHTFLMMNRPVAVQFWLDVGSSGWSERPTQPLTHPYVLARGWPPGRLWTDADEIAAETEALARLVGGLLRRCRERVTLGLSGLSETGFEQRGVLLRAFQKVLQTQGE